VTISDAYRVLAGVEVDHLNIVDTFPALESGEFGFRVAVLLD
jgi:hypothetical protein